MKILVNLPYKRIPKTDRGGQRSTRLHVGRLEKVGNPGSRIIDGLIGKPGVDIRHLILSKLVGVVALYIQNNVRQSPRFRALGC